MSKVSGIYLITCIPKDGSAYYYVGQSIDIDRRIKFHFQRLRSGKHHNRFVQRCFDRYGEESFSFEILEICEHSEIDAYEQWWLSEMVGSKKCLNISKDATAPFRGKALSAKHRENISRGGKGVERSEATKRAISAANAGDKNSMFGKYGLNNVRSKPVVGRSIADGSLLRFESAQLAEKQGFHQAAISRCCNGVIAVHLGYQWTFDNGDQTVFNEIDTANKKQQARINGAYIQRPVVGVCVETGKVIRFRSMSEAGRSGYNLKSISAVCTGVNKTHKGYYWYYDN